MKVIFILLSVFLFSCKGKKINPVIIGKSYLTFTQRPMPQGICRFYYKEYEGGGWEEFEDSCHFYKVGDTLTVIRY